MNFPSATTKVLASELPKHWNKKCTVLYPSSAKASTEISMYDVSDFMMALSCQLRIGLHMNMWILSRNAQTKYNLGSILDGKTTNRICIILVVPNTALKFKHNNDAHRGLNKVQHHYYWISFILYIHSLKQLAERLILWVYDMTYYYH